MTEYGRGPGSEPWHPEDPLYGDQGWGQQAADGQPAYGGQGQYHPQQPQQHPQSHQQQPQQYGGEWGTGQHDQYGHGQQQYGGGQQYGGQPQGGGWDTGQHGHVPYSADPVDPYGGQQQPVAYGGEQPDLYGTPDAYPPPEPPGRRGAAAEPETNWDPGPDQGEHAFFAGGGDDDGDDYDD
ncbi:hypothetical protein ACFT16_46580, partial [Streptomyces sp. NPDC056983]